MATRAHQFFAVSRLAWRPVAALGLAALLAGCGSQTKQSLGLTAPPPDPFLTVERTPLELPADMHVLPAPRPGAPSPRDPNARAMAEAALTGVTPTPSNTPAEPRESAGEAALVAAAGAEAVDPQVRETVIAEAPAPERRYALDSLFGLTWDQDPQAAAERLDPDVESERLRREGLSAPVPPQEPEPASIE